MNDPAYDISHLLESDLAFEMPSMLRVSNAPKPVVQASEVNVAAAQEALAKELLRTDTLHEEMIRRFLSMTDESQLD